LRIREHKLASDLCVRKMEDEVVVKNPFASPGSAGVG
jgi:hypothetical protein